MDFELRGKVVIVTGGARGLGRAMVKGFAGEGANVVIGDILLDVAMETAEKLGMSGSRILAVKTDVTQKADAENLAAIAMKEFGKIDILVNNAGVVRNIMFLDTEEDDWDYINNINIKGTYLVTKAVLPYMILAKQGKIVNISSDAGREGYAGLSIYCASKFAVIGLTQSLAKEMAQYNINMNAVCPGIIHTPMWDAMLDSLSEREGRQRDEIFEDWTESIPLKRRQTPEDVARAVLFLSSEVSAT